MVMAVLLFPHIGVQLHPKCISLSVYYVQGTRLQSERFLLFLYGIMEGAWVLESVLGLNVCHLLPIIL